MRERNVHQRRAHRFVGVQAPARGAHLGGQTFREVLPCDADPQTGKGLIHLGGVRGDGTIDTRGVAAVVAGDGFQEPRGPRDIARERPGLIERTAVGDQPVTRNAAVGRFDADDSAETGGRRIEPPVSVPIERGVMAAETQAAEPPLEPPGARSKSHGLRVSL